MTDEDRKRVEQIEQHAFCSDIPEDSEAHLGFCGLSEDECRFLLSTIKSLEEENENLALLANGAGKQYDSSLASLRSDLAKEREEKEKLRKSLRQYKTDMEATYSKFARAVSVENQLAYVEAQLLTANERGERMREAILAYQKANTHDWQFDPPTEEEVIKVGAEIEAAEKMMYDALTDPKDEIEEPPGIGKPTRCE